MVAPGGGGRAGKAVPAKKLFKHRHRPGAALACRGARLPEGRVGAGTGGGHRESPHTFPSRPALPSALQQLQGLRQVQSQFPCAEREGVQPGGECEWCPAPRRAAAPPAMSRSPRDHLPAGHSPFQSLFAQTPGPTGGPCAVGQPQGFQDRQDLGSHSPRSLAVLCDPAEVCLGWGAGGPLPSLSIPLPDPRG